MSIVHGIKRWQTARVVTAADTQLTNYNPDDLTAAVKAKMIAIHPAMAVALRVLGKNTNNDTATLVASGWMDPNTVIGSGPGQRLWEGTLTLGSHSSSFIPLNDKDKLWGAAAATWFEVDTYTPTNDPAGATEISVANQEGILLLPTLGYTHLLLEVLNIGGALEMTEVGIMWRPIAYERIIRTF